MPRVIDAEVKEIIDTDLTDLDSFIGSANELVTTVLTGKGLSDDRLKTIEQWLAAHFIAIRENKNRKVEEETGEARARYGENSRDVIGQGLKMTRWGQQVILLDTTGTFAEMGTAKARFTVV